MNLFTKRYKKKDTEDPEGRRRQPFPPIGQRLIKTAVAVFLCLLIHVVRGYQGMIIQSCIAAIICMQPYSKDSRKMALNRVCGTVIGGLWGLAFLAALKPFPLLAFHMTWVYAFMSLGVILALYSCVVIRLSDSAALAAIVYLCIIINYPAVEAPIVLTLYRIADTVIGVCVAILVNNLHLPRKKQTDIVFFVRLQDLVEDRYSQVSSRVLIALNRLYDDGARICLVSKWAPAFLISQLGLVEKINMPVIVIDGAAIFDVRENKYHDVQGMEHTDVEFLLEYLDQLSLCCQIIAIRERSMLIYRHGNMTPEEEKDFELMRRSPYRNYVEGDFHENDQIVQIRFIVRNEEADRYEQLLKSDPAITGRFRVSRKPQPRMAAFSGFYFYHREASIPKAEKRLLYHLLEAEEVRPVHLRPGSGNYTPERDAPILLNQLRRTYEIPVLPFLRRRKKS